MIYNLMKKIFSKINFFLQFVVPVIFMAGIIFYLSAQPGLGDIKNNVMEIFLRKGAHFTEYGVLAFFVWRLFYNGWGFLVKPAFWFSLVLTTLYACSDEFHQTLVAGRSGKPVDVLVDFLSILIILQFILFFVRRKIKNVGLALVGIMCLFVVVSMMAWQSDEVGKNLKQQVVLKTVLTNAESDIDKNNKSQDILTTGVGNIEEGVEGDSVSSKSFGDKDFVGGDIENEDLNDELLDAEKLPEKVRQKVPFTTQAPFSKWDELHEESCEEASLIMLKYYNDRKVENPAFAGQESGLSKIPKAEAEKEIQKLIKYQIEKYGDYFDTDAKTTKGIGEDFYRLKNLKIIEKFTIQDLKKELAQGNIILVPTAGRELGNPNFTPPGPLYHNLVIIGYDDKQTVDSAGHKAQGVFITNDPGTRRGQNYKYDQQVLYKAIHDFPGDVDKILEGEKRAIVLISEQ